MKFVSSMPYCLLLLIVMMLFSCKADQNNTASATNTEFNESTRTVLFFGNSLTYGYGVEPHQAFTNLIQQKIDSVGLNYLTVNAGLSGETTSGGVERVDWVLKQQVDVFVLELGGNDGLRGIPPQITKDNLITIIDKVRSKNTNVKILLAGMEAPPNMGADFVTEFRDIYKKVSFEKDVHLIPFLLQNVAGKRELNLPDGIHPNADGHKIVAETVWHYLKPLL